MEDLARCPGIGERKVRIWLTASQTIFNWMEHSL
jgi:hypothetical protein